LTWYFEDNQASSAVALSGCRAGLLCLYTLLAQCRNHRLAQCAMWGYQRPLAACVDSMAWELLLAQRPLNSHAYTTRDRIISRKI